GALGGLAPNTAHAHRFTPGLLKVQPLGQDHWQITWRAPEPSQSNLRPRFSPSCDLKALSP
ncbi:unnamed protein product, partial [Laminaria digitata]